MEGIVGVNKIRNTCRTLCGIDSEFFRTFRTLKKNYSDILRNFLWKIKFRTHSEKKRNLENIRYSSKFSKKTWKSEHKIELKKKKRQGEY